MFKIGSVENSIKMAILLQGRGKMKAYELAQELGVSERQFYKIIIPCILGIFCLGLFYTQSIPNKAHMVDTQWLVTVY